MRFLTAVLAVTACLLAQGQSMTVSKLMEWLRNPATAHESDASLAKFLSTVRLTERLDDRTIETLRGVAMFGPKTMDALHKLRDQSKDLSAPAAGSTSAMVAPPVPSAEEQGKIIDDARRYALDYSAKLPNFFCYEREHRWAAPSALGKEPDWRTQDTIVKQVTFYEQKEVEKVLQHNNTYTSQDMKSLGGSQSIGDFGVLLQQIFEPRTAAVFEWGKWMRRGQQLLMSFDFSVPLDRSNYHLEVENKSIVTAYHGSVLLDAKSHEVLRVFVEAENIPADFPLRSASDTVDYAMETIAGQKYLLPVQADVRLGAPGYFTKNLKEFGSYRKYETGVSIKYDDADLPPLPGQKPDTKIEAVPVAPAKKGGG